MLLVHACLLAECLALVEDPQGLWAAILASTIGPNLLITGSVATLISRRIARDAGARLTAAGTRNPPGEAAAGMSPRAEEIAQLSVRHTNWCGFE
jgi:hypothetical protein